MPVFGPSSGGLDPLATVDDLQGRLGRTLVDPELTKATLALADASATVRNYTRQQITQATTTDLCRLYGGTMQRFDIASSENTFGVSLWFPAVVRLPQRPATAVSAVVDVDGNPVDFLWDGGQLVGTYTAPVNVTYQHGWPPGDPVYDTVVAVVCSVAARAIGRSPEDGAVQQESISGYSYTMGAIGAAGAVGLLPEEMNRLAEIRGRKARSIGLV